MLQTYLQGKISLRILCILPQLNKYYNTRQKHNECVWTDMSLTSLCSALFGVYSHTSPLLFARVSTCLHIFAVLYFMHWMCLGLFVQRQSAEGVVSTTKMTIICLIFTAFLSWNCLERLHAHLLCQASASIPPISPPIPLELLNHFPNWAQTESPVHSAHLGIMITQLFLASSSAGVLLWI